MSVPWYDRLRNLWSSWLPLLAILLVATLVCFIHFGKASPILNLALIVPILGGTVLYVTRKLDLSARVNSTALGKPVPLPISIVDLGRAEDYIDNHYEVTAIEYFIKLLTQLPDYLSRVDHHIQVKGRQLNSVTRLTFRGAQSLVTEDLTSLGDEMQSQETCSDGKRDASDPEESQAKLSVSDRYDGTLLVPVIRARKGLLFDNSRIFGPDGSDLPTLPQWEVYGLIVVALRALFEKEVLARSDSKSAASDLGGLTDVDRRDLLQIVKYTAGAIVDPVSREAPRDAWLDLLNSLDGIRFSEEWKKQIESLCVFLEGSYLVVVEASRQEGGNLLLEYSNTITSERIAHAPQSVLRAKHGLLPHQIDVSSPWALQADSYHLEVTANSQDLYVYDHHLEKLESKKPLTQDDFSTGDSRWYVRLYHEEARSLAHLYIRRQGRNSVPGPGRKPLEPAPGGDFKSIIEFREVPPGGLGNAVTVALVTAVMVTFFALSRVGIDPGSDLGSKGNNNQDIPALILTLPAFLAAAVGRGMTADRLLSSSLTAFYGLWAVVITSLTGVLLYIYSANRELPVELRWTVGTHHPTFNLFWLLLSLISIGIFFYLRKCKNEEREYYLELLKKDPVDNSSRKANNEKKAK